MYPAAPTSSGSHSASGALARGQTATGASRRRAVVSATVTGPDCREWRCRSSGPDPRHIQVRVHQIEADGVPAVELFNCRPAALAQPSSELAILEHGPNSVRKILRIVSDQDVAAVDGREAFAAD